MAYKKNTKGVKKGFRHVWKYRGRWDETKVKPGLWKISFRATKGKRTRSTTGPKPGSKILWKINALQKAVKTGRGQYQTHLYGTKRVVKSTMK